MKLLEENQSYTYTCVGHPASTDGEGRHYCRAVRAFLQDGYALCNDCPLYGGESSTLGDSVPMCYYYDLDLSDAEEISGVEQNLRTESLINAGMIPKFPFYLTELEAVRRFGIMEQAIQFAADAHAGQTRKGSELPYICHPLEVMMLVCKMTSDPEVAAAAALHDTIEDTKTEYEDLKECFGKRIADLVAAESEDKKRDRPAGETWRERKEENLLRIADEPYEAKLIMLADKLSNLRSSYREYQKIGDQIFERFNMKDKKEHEWYHRSVAEALSELRKLSQYGEYKHLIEEIFG